MRKTKATLIALALALPVSLNAQGVGVAAHAGTMGVGADLALHLSPSLGVRVGGNFVPFDVSFDAGGISYDFDIPNRFTAMLDLHPGGSAFRLSVGVMQAKDITISAMLIDSVDVGPGRFAGSDVGTLSAVFDTKDLAPYVGIGIGNPAGGAFGFFLDLGVGIWDSPVATLTADGPISTLPSFQSDLAAEQDQLNSDIESFKVYPVFSIGFSIGFGR